MKDYEIINVNIWNPKKSIFKSSKNDRAECQIIKCNAKNNCDLFKSGQCYLKKVIGGRCPHGEYTKEIGFTKRAAKFNSWIKEREDKYSKFRNELSSPSNIMARVGDYLYLPYAHMDMNEYAPFLSQGGFMRSGSSFMKYEDFTLNVIKNIISFKPMALMGGEIKSYQNEQIPLFLMHLSEFDNKLFNRLADEKPYILYIVAEKTNIGRKAMLYSITPNVGKLVDIHKGEWVWDGEYLTSINSKASFMLTSKFDEIRIKPSCDFEIKITEEDQVNENTIFKS